MPASYTGLTTQAIITTTNAKTLSANAYSGSQFASGASGVGKVPADTVGQPLLLQETARILKNSVAAIATAHSAPAKVVTATVQDTVNGYRGTLSYSINIDQTTGSFTGTLTFAQYQDSATSGTLSGPMNFSGVFDRTTSTFSSMNISINNLTGTNGGRSYTLSGSMAFIGGTMDSVTMSVVLTDNTTGNTYWIKDFTITLAGSSLTVSGTYYDPFQGYVVISTVTPLTVSAIDATPTAGRLLFTGRNGTKARLTFTSSGYTVEADTTGNGTYVVVP